MSELFFRYGESLLNILRAVYPETQWLKKTMVFLSVVLLSLLLIVT